jgi:hypothetical protein
VDSVVVVQSTGVAFLWVSPRGEEIMSIVSFTLVFLFISKLYIVLWLFLFFLFFFTGRTLNGCLLVLVLGLRNLRSVGSSCWGVA